MLPIEGSPAWSFNGDLTRPTLSPSILARSGHYVPGFNGVCECSGGGEYWGFRCYVCHSFVRDGRIEFLSDCTHPLAGQTVDLPCIDPT